MKLLHQIQFLFYNAEMAERNWYIEINRSQFHFAKDVIKVNFPHRPCGNKKSNVEEDAKTNEKLSRQCICFQLSPSVIRVCVCVDADTHKYK